MPELSQLKSKWAIGGAVLVVVAALFVLCREPLLVCQLNGYGLPNPVGMLLTRNYDERRVVEAAQALGRPGTRSKMVVNALIKALDRYHNVDSGDGLIPVRSEIALALGRAGDPAAIQPLLDVLDSDDEATLSRSASVPPGYEFAKGTSYEAVVKALEMLGVHAKRESIVDGP
jgi:HEAT repeat protein